MRAASLPRFLQSLSVVRVGASGLPLLIVLIGLLVFGVPDGSPGPIHIFEPNPFRWT